MKSIRSWSWLIITNLILGLFLWFLYSTDYSLMGTVPDILFPPLVIAIAVNSLAIIKARGKFQKFILILAHLPSVIGGGLSILIALIMLIPPFGLGTLFMLSEISDETQIQQVVSPDGTKVADVYFRGVGAYSGGNGRILVRVTYRNFPFLERDVFYLGSSMASKESVNYLKWIDNDTLYIPEIEDRIPVGMVNLETPKVIELPYMIFQVILTIIAQEIVNHRLTVPVHDVPIYPGKITGDQWQYIKGVKTIFRSFNIEQEDTAKITKWYEENLAKSPWTFVEVNSYSYSEYGEIHIEYCIQATRTIENEEHVYFWEFRGGNDRSRGVHINIGTPHPITDTCERFVRTP